MRNLLFKNLTSSDRKRKVISSMESTAQDGLHTSVYRHLLCQILEAKDSGSILPKPILYVIKRRDTVKRTEGFYCRIKGSLYMVVKGKLYLVSYVHSLRIVLKPAMDSVVT